MALVLTSASFLILYFGTLEAITVGKGEYKRVCYYTHSVENNIKFSPDRVDAALCSHFIFGSAAIESNIIAPIEGLNNETWYGPLESLKDRNPSLKVLLSVGGPTVSGTRISRMLKTAQTRRQFIDSALMYLWDSRIDGIDLDFRHLGSGSSSLDDKELFLHLLEELRMAYTETSANDGTYDLILSMTGPTDKITIRRGYMVEDVCRYVDFVNLLSFDFHGDWDAITGLNAPLFAKKNDSLYNQRQSVAWAASYWAKNKCPRHKILIGMPAFARAFVLGNPHDNHVGALVARYKKAPRGNSTRTPGLYSYAELCGIFRDPSIATIVWPTEYRVPYAYANTLWISYDDRESLIIKVTWLKEHSYGGWLLWTIDFDDFDGTACGNAPYPLLRALNDALLMDNGDPELGALRALAADGLRSSRYFWMSMVSFLLCGLYH